ncbi:12329_t:CDS:2, partial [Acaulospora colombiana]
PRNNPHIIYYLFLNHTPTADPTQPTYILSNSDALSSLTYAFATTPEYYHSWLVFKFVQWEALRASAEVDIPAMADLSPLAFPPTPSTMDISKAIIDLWKSLDPAAILEWEELTRDIRSAYAQLVSRFGNGVVFDGDAWEDQRYYHARSLFYKWMGYQSMHSTIQNDPTAIYAPTSLAPTTPRGRSRQYSEISIQSPNRRTAVWFVNRIHRSENRILTNDSPDRLRPTPGFGTTRTLVICSKIIEAPVPFLDPNTTEDL